jgi:prepilin-type N-terminal cleavage/methylation domain-containing protein
VGHLGNDRGFTLAELLVATAVIGVVMAGVFVVQRGGQHAYLFGANRVETQQNARVVLDLMTRELRSATAVSAINESSSSPDITFVWRDEANVAHTIRYWLSGTTLNRALDGAGTPLIGGVHSLAMAYCKEQEGGTATTAPCAPPSPDGAYKYVPAGVAEAARVRVIKISLSTRTEDGSSTGSPGDARSLMESTVTLRSMLE